jgi:capsule polysaccharide export protein KpsE/RkpR
LQNASLSGFSPLLKLLNILVLRKRFILGVTFLGTAVAALTVMILPSRYRSEALVKPPSAEAPEQGQLKSMLEDAGPLSGMLGSFFGGATGENDCLNILGSVQFARLVINRFDLETRYKFKGKGKKYRFANVLKAFNKNFSFAVTDEEAIRITFEDKDPVFATQVLDFTIHTLDSMYTDIQKKVTNQKLGYFDTRVALAEKEMSSLEDSLVKFQNHNNLYLPEVQVQATLESVVKMEAELELLDQQMQLEAALRGKDSPRFGSLRVQRNLLERDIRKKFRGNRGDTSSLAFPVHSMPALANQYFRLERAYKVKLAIYKFLIQQFEFLRLEAQKNMRVIAVLDPPWPNDKRVFPMRRLVVQMVFVLLAVLSALAALVHYAWISHVKRDPELADMARDVRKNLLRV